MIIYNCSKGTSKGEGNSANQKGKSMNAILEKIAQKEEQINQLKKMYDIVKAWQENGVQVFNATKLGKTLWGKDYIDYEKDVPDGCVQGKSMSHVAIVSNFLTSLYDAHIIELARDMMTGSDTTAVIFLPTHIYRFTDTKL